MNKSVFKSLVLALGATILAVALIKYPQPSLEASIRGVNMWWEIVFPSLLPFFIISEMLISFGVVTFIGILLEPLMRPLFRVPGVGGFVWAMGMASGFPSGAKLTARFRKEKQLSKIEAERLVSFTNSSNPLFIFGAVSIGFFQNPTLGIVLAIAHYVGNFLVGIMMRFYGGKETVKEVKERNNHSIKQAFKELHRTRIKDQRPIGKMLGDAVLSSIETLLMIGGFIILFSVINKLLFVMNITGTLAYGFNYLLTVLHIPQDFSIPLIAGLFEITLGSQMTSGVHDTSLLFQAIITSFILAFSGLSVQAQTASILAQTDIRFMPFFIARIIHGFIASFITLIIWKPVYEKLVTKSTVTDTIPTMVQAQSDWFTQILHFLANIGPFITILSLMLYVTLYYKRTHT
ncbi:sporulation integral membrane protein YlbJ [Bacillus massiliigorillae]|uniref:sporulation integral membrane protein YlbJ n=1 Tax=Bacillus massiliigorillae TaxID=1243664 RepID=UPI0003A35828|nr:sporulation integral membrane protein YlbJ [Bacillus massiliigorillae]